MTRSIGRSSPFQTVRFGFAVLLVLFAPTIVRAELISYFDNALVGSSGTLTWPGTAATLSTAYVPNVSIYYAVYGRTVFESVFGVDVPGTDAFVYAYQVDNRNSAKSLSKFTVGITSGVPFRNLAQIIDPPGDGVPPVSPGTSATSSSTNATTAIWNFTTLGAIPAGGKSTILFFTSPNVPTHGKTCSVTSGALSSTAPVATPGTTAPEPSSLLLLAVGAIGLAVFRPIRSMLS
jgi:hypothetical protein